MVKIMKITGTTVIGLVWLGISMYLSISIFLNINTFGDRLFKKMGLTVAQSFSGGEVVKKIPKENYTIFLHEPVFEGFIFKAKKGFVQIDFLTTKDYMPSIIQEKIDYNLDRKIDFDITLDLKKEMTIDLTIFNSTVQQPVDKSSLFSGFIHGQKNNKRTVFTFHKHNTKEFLGFPQSKFHDRTFLTQMCTSVDTSVLDAFLTEKNRLIGKRITMKNREGNSVEVELQRGDQNNSNIRVLAVPNDPLQQKLAVLVENKVIQTAWAYTYYSAGSSVRILLKKR